MSSLSLGDLAQNYVLQRRGSALRAEMTKLNEELASGQISDLKDVLKGNFSYLGDIEADMTRLNGYETATAEAAQFTAAMQATLGLVQDLGTDLAANLVVVTSSELDDVAQQAAVEAEDQLRTIVGSLNTDIAGRSLFSGTAVKTSPLASADNILNEVRTIMAGEVGPDAKMNAVEAWFDDPAGFDSVIYQGTDTAFSPFQLSETETLSLDVKASHDAIKSLIRNVAVAALADDPALSIGVDERATLLRSSGEGILQNEAAFIAMRANVGFVEDRIDQVATRNAAEMTSLEYAKGALLSADPYETATRLEEVQFQLQSLYTVTVRSSQLSLVNFL